MEVDTCAVVMNGIDAGIERTLHRDDRLQLRRAKARRSHGHERAGGMAPHAHVARAPSLRGHPFDCRERVVAFARVEFWSRGAIRGADSAKVDKEAGVSALGEPSQVAVPLHADVLAIGQDRYDRGYRLCSYRQVEIRRKRHVWIGGWKAYVPT